jgi:hypothetical protein
MFSLIAIARFLHAEEIDSPEKKSFKPKNFIWKKSDANGLTADGYLESEKVSTAMKVSQKKFYDIIVIYLNDNRIGTIVVSKNGDEYSHNIQMESIKGYLVEICVNENKNISYIRVTNSKDELVRIVKIDPKKDLVDVGPRDPTWPW